ncbi:MAG: hydroxylase [Gemmatimonadetes bacterium]|nr:hydroxylase [Gemmatimonadota bacterium]NNK62642.1 hydroxylase [Gemmatimonadota bacterium]
MRVHYLEFVTHDVDGVCAAYAAARGVEFGDPDPSLGGARTATLSGGGLVGVRGPLRDQEAPVVRPYWLVDDIESALADAEAAGGTIALPPMELPGHGTIAIYQLGGNDHGLWQR